MSGDVHTILCGVCKVPLQGIGDGNDENVFSCPSCGASDKRKDVLSIIAKYVEEVTARAMQERLRKMTRGSKVLKLEAKPIPQRFYKYVADYKPPI